MSQLQPFGGLTLSIVEHVTITAVGAAFVGISAAIWEEPPPPNKKTKQQIFFLSLLSVTPTSKRPVARMIKSSISSGVQRSFMSTQTSDAFSPLKRDNPQ